MSFIWAYYAFLEYQLVIQSTKLETNWKFQERTSEWKVFKPILENIQHLHLDNSEFSYFSSFSRSPELRIRRIQLYYLGWLTFGSTKDRRLNHAWAPFRSSIESFSSNIQIPKIFLKLNHGISPVFLKKWLFYGFGIFFTLMDLCTVFTFHWWSSLMFKAVHLVFP